MKDSALCEENNTRTLSFFRTRQSNRLVLMFLTVLLIALSFPMVGDEALDAHLESW